MAAFDPASPYGINAHLPSSVLLDRVAAAGIAWIRVDFNMDQIQPAPGQYNWALTDQVVQDARARGLHLYPTLAYAPPGPMGGWAERAAQPDGLVRLRGHRRLALS
jgi:beta-galactosidase GanA